MPDAVWLTTSSYGSGYNDCGTCGATVRWGNKRQHENFHKNYSYRRDGEVSNVTWCDYGDHAFKTGEKGSASFAGTEFGNNGQPIEVRMDACNKHNPMAVQREAEQYSLSSEEYRELNPEPPVQTMEYRKPIS